jgi:hypothetical protein
MDCGEIEEKMVFHFLAFILYRKVPAYSIYLFLHCKTIRTIQERKKEILHTAYIIYHGVTV